MKCKHITVLLIALSILAVTFISTVAAATEYNVYLGHYKKGGTFTFYIDTTTDSTDGPFDGRTVNPNSIYIAMYDGKDRLVTIHPVDIGTVLTEENRITINLKWSDVPKHATYPAATGDVGTAGNTFAAAGPGWGWGGHY